MCLITITIIIMRSSNRTNKKRISRGREGTSAHMMSLILNAAYTERVRERLRRRAEPLALANGSYDNLVSRLAQ